MFTRAILSVACWLVIAVGVADLFDARHAISAIAEAEVIDLVTCLRGRN